MSIEADLTECMGKGKYGRRLRYHKAAAMATSDNYLPKRPLRDLDVILNSVDPT